ncbi:hypothetical protein LTR10_022452 [Elasticomyces elasticus]|uniref:FAD-binding domain-containing protein n=1 Tax=Exophiala sideris TaxID=1016849 RepID=A0ABR0J344_9EURO|nr:hypothetical protein LTR10_022452 [Elasticomyces elasticus]KAK5024888.1 hypothetical protein LTS07_008266 [Exophiala sideris]KAK5031522.1 hypothetical protein LTR13_007850 [Exophiala sideris]KAK5054927.1 hypothetical protein LTR69_008495 [Exophiala sideris]KAK5179806.1 hypothetical protein LTR44_007622 [Eurotiomycetes sp. CCFEE 6388]
MGSIQENTRQRSDDVDETLTATSLKKSAFTDGDFDHSQIPLAEEQWPVIIIGSSMVGKMLGLLLGYHGIKSISFDRHPSSGTHPRAAGLNFRTSEILRQLGLEDFTLEQSKSEFDLNAGMVVVEKLVNGKTLAHLQEHDPEKVKEITPSQWVWISQSMFEPIMGDNAEKFQVGAVQQHGHEVVHYEEQSDGVIVVVRPVGTNDFKKYKAPYVVACDGGRSPTRQKEGIKWDGPGVLRNSLGVSFEADMTPYLGTRAVHGVIYVANSKIGGGFRMDKGGKKGLLMVNNVGERTDFPPGSVTAEEAKQWFYDCAGLGEEELKVDMKTRSYWTMAAYSADRLVSRGGRVFLAGDSAHVMPPTGGLGGNTGLADAHNIAWKLAFVLKGFASHALLESYNNERQPVDTFTVLQAHARFQNRVVRQNPPAPEVDDIAVELGYRYPKGAFLHPGGYLPPKESYDAPASPSAAAGSRFPHAWLVDASDASKRISSLDLVKQNLLLIASDNESPWIDAAKGLQIPIDTYTVNESSKPWRDPEGRLKQRARLQGRDAVLVRPDGFIAWRAENVQSGHEDVLKGALQSILKKN